MDKCNSGAMVSASLRGIVLAATALALAACSPVAGIRPGVEQLARTINAEFATVRQANESMVAEFNAVYARIGSLDLDTAVLETAAGGAFRVFGDNQFYYKSKQEGACYYYSPGGKPPTDAAKREIRIITYAEGAMQKAWQSAPDLITVVFYGLDDPVDLGAMVPWNDVVSILLPGIKLKMFEWYTRGLGSSGPSLWVKEPFVDLTTGWVMDVAGPVLRDGGRKGATVISVNLGKLCDKYLAKASGNLLLLSRAGIVVGASPSAASLLGVTGLSADILQKSKENRFASADYLLGATGQAPLAAALAASLAEGGTEGRVTGDGKTRGWLVATIPEVNFRLVGFTD